MYNSVATSTSLPPSTTKEIVCEGIPAGTLGGTVPVEVAEVSFSYPLTRVTPGMAAKDSCKLSKMEELGPRTDKEKRPLNSKSFSTSIPAEEACLLVTDNHP